MEVTPNIKNLVKKFVRHCVVELGLSGPVHITLSLQPQGNMPTAGHFDPVTKSVVVSIKNRAIADCLRTIAHELTHLKQLQQGVEFPEDDEHLQPYEDEANVMSGRLVRFFGRENREIYSDLR